MAGGAFASPITRRMRGVMRRAYRVVRAKPPEVPCLAKMMANVAAFLDEAADMQRLLGWGADALISNRPDLAVACVTAFRSGSMRSITGIEPEEDT